MWESKRRTVIRQTKEIADLNDVNSLSFLMGLLLSSMAVLYHEELQLQPHKGPIAGGLLDSTIVNSQWGSKGSVWSKEDKGIVFRLFPLFFIYLDKISFSQMTELGQRPCNNQLFAIAHVFKEFFVDDFSNFF